MFRCCSMCSNSPEALAAFILHASDEPFERRPCAFVVPQRLCAVRPSGGQLQLATFTARAKSALRRCCTRTVDAPAIQDLPDKLTSTRSEEHPYRFQAYGRGSN